MLNNLSRFEFYNKCAVIQMSDGKLPTSKGCQKIDFDINYKVVMLPAESFMRLLFNHNKDIARLSRWRLVTFPTEGDSLTAFHSLVDMDLEYFFVRNNLL